VTSKVNGKNIVQAFVAGRAKPSWLRNKQIQTLRESGEAVMAP